MQNDYRPPAGLLAGRNILITGAGDGIGAALAKACAAAGATVILLGRTERKLIAINDSIVDAGQPQPWIFPMDLAKATAEDIEDFAAGLGAQIPALHGIVHNAAILGAMSPIDHYPTKKWDEVLQVNITAAFQLTRALLPLVRRAEPGSTSIVFTSSGVGQRGHAYWGAYSVSKFAVEGFAQVLSEELEHDRIRVNVVDPGIVRTNMRAHAYPAEDPNQWPAPEEITDAYLYLLGHDSAHVHGERLHVWTRS